MTVDIDKITLIGPRVLLEETHVDAKTKSGIIIPGATETQYKYGKVVKIGTDLKEVDEVKDGRLSIGATVMYSPRADKVDLAVDGGPKRYIFADYERRDIILIL